MKIDVLPDSDTVAREAAKFSAAEARAAILALGRFLFAVSGGHTPWLMLRAVAGEVLPWAEVHLVQVDERWPPRGTLTAISPTNRKVSWRASRCEPNTFTPCRPGDRHEGVRGVGPAQGAAEEVRLRAGGGDGGCDGISGGRK